MAGRAGAMNAADQKLIDNSMRVSDGLFALSLGDIRSPTPSTIRRFYPSYLAELNLCPGLLADIKEFHDLPHNKIYESMLQDGLLLKAMNYFLSSCGSSLCFTITDVISPSPARHRQFLTELIGCVQLTYVTEELHYVEVKKREERMEQLQKLRDEVNRLQNNKTHLLLERGFREDKIKDFDKKMSLVNEQFKKLSSEMSEQRQKANELQQELEESAQKHQQLTQSKELHINKLKQLEGQLVNSPARYKRDLSVIEASVKCTADSIKEREGILHKRQDMEAHLGEYLNVLKVVKDKAVQLGDLKKKSIRKTASINELMSERQKLGAVIEKVAKEKAGASDRLSKLSQKSNAVSQTMDRKFLEMRKTHNEMKEEEHRLNDLQVETQQTLKFYAVDKVELETKQKKLVAYEAKALDLMNFMYKTEVNEAHEEFDAIVKQKFDELKHDFENRMPSKQAFKK